MSWYFLSQVMELSENLKLNLGSPPGGTSPDLNTGAHGSEATGPEATGPEATGPEATGPAASGLAAPGSEPRTTTDVADSQSDDPSPNDDAESQMRKALGLMGDSPRHRPEPERMDQTARMGDRFNGGLHRRRFVQDGDVPVTVLRREPPHDAPAHRGVVPATGPTSSRLQRTEAALAAETAARDKAERSLADTQAVVRDLQTKIGHAELAKSEAIEALRRARETLGSLRAEVISRQEQLSDAFDQLRLAERSVNLHQDQLAEERNARRNTERALRMAEAARESAQQLVRALSEDSPTPTVAETAQMDAQAESSHRHGRRAEPIGMEPEPVKWWLNTKSSGKKR